MFRKIHGISKKIDGVSGLLVKKAAQAHKRLSNNDKRWIDPEDILQEGLITALETENRLYQDDGGSRFSTYLWRGLDWRMANFAASLHQQKRTANDDLLELDAPVRVNEGVRTLEDLVPQPSTQGNELNAIRSFVALCRSLSESAIIVLIRGLIMLDVRKLPADLCAEIANEASLLGIGPGDLAGLTKDENIRKKLLTSISQNVMISEGTEEALRCLTCTECGGTFTIAAIREGRFYVQSMTCTACLRKLAKAPPDINCFGKGLSLADADCRLHCKDKAACIEFTKRGEKKMSSKVESIDDVDFSDVEAPGEAVVPAKKKKKAAPAVEEKPAKKKKAAPAAEEKPAKKKAAPAAEEKPAKKKAPVEDEDPAPKAVGEWPYKRGSIMLAVFKAFLAGIAFEDAKKLVKKLGGNWDMMLRTMKKHAHRRHTWKVDEDGGVYKIRDVKFLGK